MPPRKYYYYETKNIVLDIIDLEKLVKDGFTDSNLIVPYYYLSEEKISKYGLRLEDNRLKVIRLKIQVRNKSRIFIFHLITSFDIDPACSYTSATRTKSGYYNCLEYRRDKTIFFVKNVDLTERIKMINVKYYGGLV